MAMLLLAWLAFAAVPRESTAEGPSTPPATGIIDAVSTNGEAQGEGDASPPVMEESEQHDQAKAGPEHGEESPHGEGEAVVPSILSVIPFVALLLMIAGMPLIPRLHHWWEQNSNRLLAACALGGVTCAYYGLRAHGFHHAEPGLDSVLTVLNHAILVDYIPFIVLLFSLFTISGGIYIGGDIPAHPRTNAALLLIGASLASFIGTTGASMLLIRPLLQINIERRHVKHTVIFFIFLVSNVGGCLLPIGDPPLFLGYLRGVPFLWTLSLFKVWALCVGLLIAIYWMLDQFWFHPRETLKALQRDETEVRPFHLKGGVNLLLLGGVILAVALLVPGRAVPGTSWALPDLYIRELVLLGLAGVSMLVTPAAIRKANAFSFYAIGEVAALFIGIFITMQAPVEILNLKGPDLGLHTPAQFFWATGLLSSFLDNAPTYVVFFQTAGTLDAGGLPVLHGVATATGQVALPLLTAVSLGAVFMGACTYIGNGPNFMVKSIAENYNIKMPSFFGYMGYSFGFLFPVFALITWIFFV